MKLVSMAMGAVGAALCFVAPQAQAELPAEAQFAAPVFVAEEQGRYALVQVRRRTPGLAPFTVRWRTEDGTTVAGQDYVAGAGTLRFGQRQRVQILRVALKRDRVPDGAETIRLILESSGGQRMLDAATLVLRESPLFASSSRPRPGEVLQLRGRFDPGQPMRVSFSDHAGRQIGVLASQVTERSAVVRVPVLDEADTPAELAVGPVAIQAEQGARVFGPVAPVVISPTENTGELPGIYALEFLRMACDTLAAARERWQVVEDRANGAVDASALQARLQSMEDELDHMAADLLDLVEGRRESLPFGSLDGIGIELDHAALVILDQLLVAAAFDGNFEPSPAGFPIPPVTAPTQSMPLEPGSALEETFELFQKMNEVGQTQAGKVFEALEILLKWAPGSALALARAKEVFSATMYFSTILAPSIMGAAVLAAVSPFMELELGRPVSREAYAPAVRHFVLGTLAFLNEHRGLGQVLDRIRALPGGHDLADSIETFFPDVEGVAQMLDVDDANSLISTAFGASETIYANRPRPAVSIDNAFVVEPASGKRNAFFTVTLDRPFEEVVTVHYETVPGTAGLADFIYETGTIRLPIGKVEAVIDVAVLADKIPEPDEQFFVRLTEAVNATLDRDQALCTIHDPSLSVQIQSFTAEVADADASMTTYWLEAEGRVAGKPGEHQFEVGLTLVEFDASQSQIYDIEAKSQPWKVIVPGVTVGNWGDRPPVLTARLWVRLLDPEDLVLAETSKSLVLTHPAQ